MKKFLYNHQIFCFSLFIIISCSKEDSSKSKEDYYLGGISLSRNESLTIENKNILINGNITLNDNSSLIIGTKRDVIIVDEIQVEGKKRMNIPSLISGNKEFIEGRFK